MGCIPRKQKAELICSVYSGEIQTKALNFGAGSPARRHTRTKTEDENRAVEADCDSDISSFNGLDIRGSRYSAGSLTQELCKNEIENLIRHEEGVGKVQK